MVCLRSFFCQDLEWGGHFFAGKAGKGNKEKVVNAPTKWQNKKHLKSGLNKHTTVLSSVL